MKKDIRFEFKYILNRRQAVLIESYVKKIGLKKDKSNGGTYMVTSLYFDTPMLDDYYDKLSGLKQRKKLRARIYESYFDNNKVDKVWLEIKNKHDMTIKKNRTSISFDKWQEFVNNKGSFFDISKISAEHANGADNFSYLFAYKNYKPYAVVRYKRKAFVENFFSNIRLTFDSDLETCKWKDFKYNGNMLSIEPGKVIMEIKFSLALPWWFKDMVYRFGLSRQAFSKYTHAIDTITNFNLISR